MERWSGSIEAGVTLIRPEDLDFPNTMTDIDYDTWMLSGSAVMRDGQTVRMIVHGRITTFGDSNHLTSDSDLFTCGEAYRSMRAFYCVVRLLFRFIICGFVS